eukprot:CAMPEP_0116116406 /NCGR_PEP_ID=MMETSP0329-20121206/1021_1 /TAXON_ID=697910 /ORGANISM="Pseudo-nitzschia arenysensis, Strain B593" /LENGTH=336 /DNA_ID=CAMNT_0003609899 /DNA_START=30 /DNA_END=1040 /DNA_ORIENTATION=-
MKYAIVTGASPSSIGFLAAKKLASPEFGYKVILACRSSAKGKQSEEMIRNAYPSSEVAYVHLDLSSFDSIRKFVEEVHTLDDGAIVDPSKPESSLKLLVNNAGIGWGQVTPFLETLDGLEEIAGVNHFGTFLLTQLLLEDLKKAEGGSRVVMVSSSLHEMTERVSKMGNGEMETDPIRKKLVLADFPDGLPPSKDNFDGLRAYQISKLCNVWYTYELQRRLDDGVKSPVRVNAMCPGFIPATGLTRRAGKVGEFFLKYVLDSFRYFGKGPTRSPEDGAETIVQTGTSDVASIGGQYFSLPRGETTITAIASSDESLDKTKAKAMFELSLKICKLEK